MFLKRFVTLLSSLMLMALSVLAASAAETKDEIVSAAFKNGNLYIYSAVEQNLTDPLKREFSSLYPGIKVDIVNMPGIDVFNRHMRDIAAGKVSADILWSREIPLQAALVKDGYALKYRPADADSVMPWAVIDDSAYATAFEPVVMVYNKRAFPKADFPATHKLMQKAFREERFKGMVGMCDPEKSDPAFLLLTQDLAYAFDFWAIAKSLGVSGVKYFPDYSSLLAGVSSGAVSFGYNVPLSEAMKHSPVDENISWYYPADYTLALPQISIISKGATNPDAAKLWTEFILSKNAQQIISGESKLLPVRKDVEGGAMSMSAKGLMIGQNFKPVATGAEVSRYNDSGLKKGFILRWKQLLKLVK